MKTLSILMLMVTGCLIPALASATSCDCLSGDTTYAECFNRLGQKWEVLYNAKVPGQDVAAKTYLDGWNAQGLGAIGDANPYYEKYNTCDFLPNGRRAIFYFFNGSSGSAIESVGDGFASSI